MVTDLLLHIPLILGSCPWYNRLDNWINFPDTLFTLKNKQQIIHNIWWSTHTMTYNCMVLYTCVIVEIIILGYKSKMWKNDTENDKRWQQPSQRHEKADWSRDNRPTLCITNGTPVPIQTHTTNSKLPVEYCILSQHWPNLQTFQRICQSHNDSS